MVAKGCKECLCDLSNVVAFGHNKQWLPKGAAKVSTKLAGKISPNGNTGRQLAPAAAAGLVAALALGAAGGRPFRLLTFRREDLTNGPV